RLSDHLLPQTRAYHEIWLDGEPVASGAPEPDPIYGTRYLPRKFKIALAFPDDNCCDVHSNDLCFLVVTRGDRLAGFNVLVGGGIRDGTDRRLRSALRSVVETVGSGVRVTPQQNLLLTDIPDGQRRLVDRILADHGVAPHGALSVVRRWAMACPALPTCGLAVAEAERVLPDVIAGLEAELERLGVADAALTVRMTGCPNGCARPYTADLAFVGRSLHKYGVFVGGSMLGTRLGTLYADPVPRDRLVATVRPLFERYRDERLDDERFGDFCHRVGIAARRASVPVSS